ncbi:MAG: hypothetical protein FJ333_07875 [Sphingomonadales bacterium]|nr:hypothetical protein [Sphingomonadales bacterium]
MYKKDFLDLMGQLGQIVKLPGRNAKRVARNVFGDLISDLTGLATGKQLEAERIEIHDTNKKVKNLLEHEIVMDHAIERIGNELVKTNRSSSRVMAWVEHQMRLYAQYRWHKVRGGEGGGGRTCRLPPPPPSPHKAHYYTVAQRREGGRLRPILLPHLIQKNLIIGGKAF